MIDYNSDVEYFESTKTIKIPENLLKEEETKSAYEKVVRIEENINRYQIFEEKKREEENQHYLTSIEVTNRLAVVSYIEIAIILAAGLYQFFTIRKFLIDKQYMWLCVCDQWPMQLWNHLILLVIMI